MGRPQENPAGYPDSSPVNQAGHLQGKLMIAHATGDDNVHFANTSELINALIAAGRYPDDVMILPGRGHSMGDHAARVQLYQRITNSSSKIFEVRSPDATATPQEQSKYSENVDTAGGWSRIDPGRLQKRKQNAGNAQFENEGRTAGLHRRYFVCALFGNAPLDIRAGCGAGADYSQISPADPAEALLETGFRHLYELDFRAARSDFPDYQKAAPNDPMGKSAEAASYLYEQFNAKGVLSSEFFLNDDTFLGGVKASLPRTKREFVNTNRQAREMAKQQLKSNPHDTRGCSLTLTDGMESDYDAIIQKKQFPALGMMRQAESEAAALLA